MHHLRIAAIRVARHAGSLKEEPLSQMYLAMGDVVFVRDVTTWGCTRIEFFVTFLVCGKLV